MRDFYKVLFGIVLIGVISASVYSNTNSIFLGCLTFGVLFLLGLIPREKEGLAYDSVSPDISALAAYAGKHAKTLHRRLLLGMSIANDITVVPNIKHALNLTKLIVNNGPKPYTGVFQSKGNDLKYSGRVLTVNDFQRDILVDPKKYRTTYLGEFRNAGEGVNNKSIPFAQYTIEAIIDENSSALSTQTGWKGIGKAGFTSYNASSTYAVNDYISYSLNGEINYFKVLAVTTAGQNPETHPAKFADANALAITVGLGTQIINGRTSGDISKVITTGALTSGAYEKFKKVYRGHNAATRAGKQLYMYCSFTAFDALVDDLESNITKYTETDGTLKYLPRTDKGCILKPVDWIDDANKLICTTKENLLLGTDLLSDLNQLSTLPRMYQLEMGLTGVIGFNYQDGELITMNDM